MAEGLTCLVGVLTYVASTAVISWKLAPYLLIGAVASVPLSALTVKVLKTGLLQSVIGIITVLLGGLTLYNIFLLSTHKVSYMQKNPRVSRLVATSSLLWYI